MKRNSFLLSYLLTLLLLVSCADTDMVETVVGEPESLVATDYLKDYQPLKDYTSLNLGIDATPEMLTAKDMPYRLIVTNFTEAQISDAFEPAALLLANGNVKTKPITATAAVAQAKDLKLFGHSLVSCDHANATYLNSLLVDRVTRPEGDEGGYCMKVTKLASSGNYNDVRVLYNFAKAPTVVAGYTYRVRFWVKGSNSGSIQVATYADGKTSTFKPNITVTTKWTQVQADVTMTTGITLLKAVAFHLGRYAGLLYIDNIEVHRVQSSGKEGRELITSNQDMDDAETTAASISVDTDPDATLDYCGVSSLGDGYDPDATYIALTDDEKATILRSHLSEYIPTILGTASSAFSGWDVVESPLDNLPYNEPASESSFQWGQYMDKDYVADAFSIAAEHAAEGVKLFINETGLTDAARCQQLVDLICYATTQGARIDGIGTEIVIDSTDYDINAIRAMFTTLAATGKLVRISKLDVRNAATNDATALEARYKSQKKIMQEIIQTYRTVVPVAQQYGICINTLIDDNSQTNGLWKANYDRKHAYAAVADGLK